MNKREMIFALILSVLLLFGLKYQTNASQVDNGYPRIYDVPMSRENQEELFRICLEYDVDPKFILALIKTESNFDPDVISKTNDYGLMQINKRNHEWLSEELGITDFLDPIQNMQAGVYVISGYLKEYPDYHKMLMVYNMGETGASKLFKQGIFQSKYSKKVMENYDSIKFVKEVE